MMFGSILLPFVYVLAVIVWALLVLWLIRSLSRDLSAPRSRPPARGAGGWTRFFVRRVHEAEEIPPWFGVAWRRWAAQESVCMPMPLNVVAARVRRAYLWFKRGGVDVPIDPVEAFEAGMGLERARWVGYIDDPIA